MLIRFGRSINGDSSLLGALKPATLVRVDQALRISLGLVSGAIRVTAVP